MKYLRLIAIATIAVAILVSFTLVRRRIHAIQLTTYMANGQALRAGAPVRLAGVDIGFVKSVRVRPELKDNPVEVLMSIDTPYEPQYSSGRSSCAGNGRCARGTLPEHSDQEHIWTARRESRRFEEHK